MQQQYEEIVPGVTAIKVGGHFEGSMVLHWDGHLFIADTFVNVPVSFGCHLLKPENLSRL